MNVHWDIGLRGDQQRQGHLKRDNMYFITSYTGKSDDVYRRKSKRIHDKGNNSWSIPGQRSRPVESIETRLSLSEGWKPRWLKRNRICTY